MRVYTYDYNHDFAPAAPFAEIQVTAPDTSDKITVSAMIDSGADATLLPRDLLSRINARPIDTRTLRTVTGIRTTVNLYRVNLELGPHLIKNIHAVGNTSSEGAILGRDVLNHLIITLNGLAQVCEISE